VADCFEEDNEPSGSIKCRKFHDYPRKKELASEEGLCSKELDLCISTLPLVDIIFLPTTTTIC
jgi:hypothetical protein